MSNYNIAKYEFLYRNNPNDNYIFEIEPSVLATLGTANEDEFYSFIARFQKIGAVAVSKDMKTYMNISDLPITREMLLAVSPANNIGSVHLIGARVYVELQDESGDIVHPDGGKSIKALHKAGRERMTWEALQQAFVDYGADNLILQSELAAFMELNGYNTESEV